MPGLASIISSPAGLLGMSFQAAGPVQFLGSMEHRLHKNVVENTDQMKYPLLGVKLINLTEARLLVCKMGILITCNKHKALTTIPRK